MTLHDKFLMLRKYFLWVSQILGLIVCICLIYNVKSYEVSWNLFSYIFPTVTEKINVLIHSVGTYVLIIPLGIIILAIIYPENIKLKLLSSFFGIASTLLILISGFLKNTIGEVYNMKIFLITRILTLKQKQDLFREEYIKIIDERYNKSIDLYNHLQEHLLQKYWDVYNLKLGTLYESMAIKVYANEVIQNIVKIFLKDKETHLHETALTYVTVLKYTVYIAMGLVTVALAATIIRYCMNNDAIVEGAKLSRHTAELGANASENIRNTQEIVKDFMLQIIEETTDIGQRFIGAIITKLQAGENAIARAFISTNKRIDVVEASVKIQAQAITEMQDKLKFL